MVVTRIVTFLLGGALAAFGFFVWMISNDGIGGEASMKVVGGAAILIGLIFCGGSLLWTGSGGENEKSWERPPLR